MKWICSLLLGLLGVAAQSQSTPEVVWQEGQGQFIIGRTTPSPDGKWVLDGDGRIRHAQSLQLKLKMRSQVPFLSTFSDHSQWVMGCASDGIRFFLPFLDLQTGVLKATTQTPIDVIALSINGNQAFVTADSNDAVLWSRIGGIWIKLFTWPLQGDSHSGALAVSPDRKFFAVGTWGPKVRVYDLVNRSVTPVAEFAVPNLTYQRNLKFSSDGAHLLAICGLVRIWRTADWTHVRDVTVPQEWYTDIQPASNPSEFWLSHSYDPKKISRFNLDGSELFSIETKYEASGMSLLSDGRLLASILPGFATIDANDQLREGPGAMGDLTSIGLTSDGRWVAATAWDSYIRVYDRVTGQERLAKLTSTASSRTTKVCAVPDGLRWVVKDEEFSSAQGNNSIKVYDMVGNLVSPLGLGSNGGALDVCPVAHPSLGLIAAASHDQSVRVLRLSNYTFPVSLGLTNTVDHIVFSPDGARLAVVYGQTNLRIYRTADWVLQHQETFGAQVRDLVFDHVGGRLYLLSGSTDVLVRKRSGDTWAVDGVVSAPEFGNKLAVSRDSRLLAIGSYRQIKFIYLPTRAPWTTWQETWINPTSLRFSIANDQVLFGTGPMLYCVKNPYPAFITSMTVSPTSIQPGQSSALTVTLTKPAPAGGLTIQLTDYTPNVWTPATLKIPAGQFSATTNLYTLPTSKPGTYTIVGTLFGVNASTRVTVAP